MFLPEGYTEKDIIKTVNSIANKIAPGFVFGSYQLEDIKQEIWKEALKCLPRYDKTMFSKLSTFLYTHIKNRLINLLRDKYHRPNPPCEICHKFSLGEIDKTCSGTRKRCQHYNTWAERNLRKVHLAKNSDKYVDMASESHDTKIEKQELIHILDMKLSPENRKTFLQLKAGQTVKLRYRQKLLNEMKEILTEEEFSLWAE